MQSRTYNLCAKFVLLSVITEIIYSNIQIPQINFTSSKIYQEKIKEFINNIMEYPRTRLILRDHLIFLYLVNMENIVISRISAVSYVRFMNWGKNGLDQISCS